MSEQRAWRGLAFCLVCVPPKTSHHAKRIVRIGRFARLADKPELVEAKQTLDDLLRPHQPAVPLVGPYRLTLEFDWPWRASEPKRRRALGRVPMTSKPDCDNAAKTVTDRLVRLRFIEDDAAICDLRVRKFWGDEAGIRVVIETVEG